MEQISHSFKDFIVKNGVVSTTAGITIGFATVTFVKSLVADVVMPLIFMVIVGGLKSIDKDSSKFFSQFLANKEFRFTNFVSELITWILIIVSAFVCIMLIVRTMGPSPVSAPQQQPFTGQVIVSSPQAVHAPPKVREEYVAFNGGSSTEYASWK